MHRVNVEVPNALVRNFLWYHLLLCSMFKMQNRTFHSICSCQFMKTQRWLYKIPRGTADSISNASLNQWLNANTQITRRIVFHIFVLFILLKLFQKHRKKNPVELMWCVTEIKLCHNLTTACMIFGLSYKLIRLSAVHTKGKPKETSLAKFIFINNTIACMRAKEKEMLQYFHFSSGLLLVKYFYLRVRPYHDNN